MNFDEYKNIVKKTRATRRFRKDVIVKNEDLKEVLDITRIASSAKNMQPLKYITVSKKDLVKKIANSCKWAAHLKDWDQSEDEEPSAFIIILNDKSIDGFTMFDCGIAVNSIMLGLKIKGYSACPLASIDKELCKDTFDIPENIEPLLGIAVGVEDETINIVKVEKDTNYYRNEKDEHCVPKRDLDEILLGSF